MRESTGAEDDLSSLSPSDEDLQFLVGLDGGLVISDPLGVKVGPGYKKNVQMIDVLINLARAGKKK